VSLPAVARCLPAHLPAGLALIVSLVLALAACGGAAGPDGSEVPSPGAQALECRAEGYPCLLSEVTPEVVARSWELGAEAMDTISGGTSASEAAAWLQEQDGVAEVQVTGTVIRFRLEGGRPTWILSAADPGAGAAALDGSGSPTAFADPQARVWSMVRPPVDPDEREPDGAPIGPRAAVVGTDPASKSAIVLSPYAFKQDMPGVRDIAQLLGETRGYEGRVTHLANATSTSRDVDISAFHQLAGHAVVYVNSIGGAVCDPGQAPGDTGCRSVIAAEPLDDPALVLDDDANEIVDLVIFQTKEKAYGVGEDFFWQAYPLGLPQGLVFLDVLGLDVQGSPGFAEGIQGSLLGRDTEVHLWTASEHDTELLRPERAEIIRTYLANLVATGRSTEVAFAELRGTLEVPGDTKLRRISLVESNGLRIREIVSLFDPGTGNPVNDGDSLLVTGIPGDGEPDRVEFAVEIDGMSGDEASRTTINVVIDDVQSEPLLVSEGEQLDDLAWRVTGGIDLPDVREGQAVTVLTQAQLPEGGTTRQTRSVKLSGLPDLGRLWAGEFTAVWNDDGWIHTLSATATFERRPGATADAVYLYYDLVEGSMTWSIGGQSSAGCTPTASSVTVPIPVHPENVIVFDITDAVSAIIRYEGFGKVPSGPSVTVSVTCPERSYEFSTRAEGTFFLAPESEKYSLVGGVGAGTFVTGGNTPTSFDWTIIKVD
jgi:hypothetical protein